MTKFPMAALLKQPSSAPTPPTSPTTTSTSSIQLNPCEAENYIVDTVTLDLRDIQFITNAPTPKLMVDKDGKPIVGADGKPKQEIIVDTDRKKHEIWSVVLQTNDKDNNFIRQNTQTFPATCAPAGSPSADAKMEQTDVPQYSILFADLTQANRFVKLLNNVIPTLNPPVLIPAPK
jgi:hypothetical protein